MQARKSVAMDLITPHLGTPVEKFPADTLKALFKISSDIVTKICQNNGLHMFADEYRAFRFTHKVCKNCGEIFYMGNNRIALCPKEGCQEFNANFMRERFRKSGSTKLKNHGDSNYNNRKKFKETSFKKWGVDNPNKTPEMREKISAGKKRSEETNKARRKAQTGMEYPHLQGHLKNVENLNAEFIVENFVINGFFHKRKAHDYFGYREKDVGGKFGVARILKNAGYEFPTYHEENYSEKKFLDDVENLIGMPIIRQYNFLGCRLDGFVKNFSGCLNNFKIEKSDKVAIEYLGDFWHGNPLKYSQDAINPRTKKPFGLLWEGTTSRFRKLIDAGVRILYIWEGDYRKDGLNAIKEYERDKNE